jgi:hypothetical protein
MMNWIERQERSRLAAIYAAGTLAIALVLAVATVASGDSSTGTATAPADSTDAAAPSAQPLLDAPGSVTLPLVDAGSPVVVRINILDDDADVTVEVVNPHGITVAVAPREGRSLPVEIARTGVHACEQYAGTIVASAESATGAADVTVTEVRYGACDLAQPPAAPDTVHHTQRVWGDEGRAPWDAAAAEDVPTEEPTDRVTEEPLEPAPEPEPAPPAPEPEPTASSTPTSEPTATAEPTATTEPTAQPTSEPTDDPDPEPTSPSEPEPEPTATEPTP